MDDAPATAGFLEPPPDTADAQRMYADDLGGQGYVANVTRLWAHQPALLDGIADLMGRATDAGGITFRQRAVLVMATASTLGDSYCSLAWGQKLADRDGPEAAVGVLRGDDAGLDDTERALARWARRVVRDPNAIAAADVDELRAAGFDDGRIFAITTYVALRLAFSVVNDALGARPDGRFRTTVPDEVRSMVTFGREIAE